MTAREAVIEAMRRLERRHGRTVFEKKLVAQEAEALRPDLKASTISTHISSHMVKGSSQYGWTDLERVDRGRYRLVDGSRQSDQGRAKTKQRQKETGRQETDGAIQVSPSGHGQSQSSGPATIQPPAFGPGPHLPVPPFPADTSSSHLQRAGSVTASQLDIPPPPLPSGRARHRHGIGPFAVLHMPPLPASAGIYIWTVDGQPVYVGKTNRSLKTRLGPAGYSSISAYKTLAATPSRRNGGQQTNCRINALANRALLAGHRLEIWCQALPAEQAAAAEADWMRTYGVPTWNKRDER